MKYNYNDVIKYWQSQNINTVEKLDTILDNFRVLFAYNSGAIENSEITYHDTREIFANGKIIGFTGNLRTIFEISNQKYCYEYLLEKIIDKESLSEELIKKVHKILTRDTYDNINKERPGEYKKHDYVTGREEVGAKASDVSLKINELVKEINEVSVKDAESIIKMVTYFHCQFENIHAFADGNGRVGRTLINYLLMINNLPPLIVYEEDKKYYYAVLEKFDKEEDIKSMEEFLKYEMEKTWEKTLDKERS